MKLRRGASHVIPVRVLHVNGEIVDGVRHLLHLDVKAKDFSGFVPEDGRLVVEEAIKVNRDPVESRGGFEGGDAPGAREFYHWVLLTVCIEQGDGDTFEEIRGSLP